MRDLATWLPFYHFLQLERYLATTSFELVYLRLQEDDLPSLTQSCAYPATG